jgi:hypothetical protein
VDAKAAQAPAQDAGPKKFRAFAVDTYTGFRRFRMGMLGIALSIHTCRSFSTHTYRPQMCPLHLRNSFHTVAPPDSSYTYILVAATIHTDLARGPAQDASAVRCLSLNPDRGRKGGALPPDAYSMHSQVYSEALNAHVDPRADRLESDSSWPVGFIVVCLMLCHTLHPRKMMIAM